MCLIRVSWGKIQADVLHERHRWNWFLIQRRICQDAQVWSISIFHGCVFFFSLPSGSSSALFMCCRSFIEISNGALSKSQAEDGIKAMMQTAGFDHKEKISWQDFHFLLRDHEKELQFAQLNVKGRRKFCLRKSCLNPHPHSDESVRLLHVCIQGWRDRGRSGWVETRECPSSVQQTGETTGHVGCNHCVTTVAWHYRYKQWSTAAFSLIHFSYCFPAYNLVHLLFAAAWRQMETSYADGKSLLNCSFPVNY